MDSRLRGNDNCLSLYLLKIGGAFVDFGGEPVIWSFLV